MLRFDRLTPLTVQPQTFDSINHSKASNILQVLSRFIQNCACQLVFKSNHQTGGTKQCRHQSTVPLRIGFSLNSSKHTPLHVVASRILAEIRRTCHVGVAELLNTLDGQISD